MKNKEFFKINKYIFLTILFFSIFVLTGCTNKEEESRNRIKDITTIDVPNDSTIAYHHYDDVFVNGRRAQYTVFVFEEEPTNWLDENDFISIKDYENEGYFLEYFGFLTLEIEDIPNEYLQDFELDYLWIRTENVYFFYYPTKLMLTVFIAGS